MLQAIIRVKNARNILKIDTSVGHSTIWCAGVESGRVIIVEQNLDKVKRVKENFQRVRVSKR